VQLFIYSVANGYILIVIEMAKAQGKVCSSCGRLTDKYVLFKCPSCGDENIIRCNSCRETHTKYKCSKCSFEGP
jgi:predicted RNA-binding Zn-ribbon protein involved in translation (DUF1610 family)